MLNSVQAQLRIMPLGNSITYDNSTLDGLPPSPTRPLNERIAYRKKLYELLTNAGYNFDFVGSENAGSALLADSENAGFPGIEAGDLRKLLTTGKIVQNNPFLYNKNDQVTTGPYLDAYNPNVILLHIGTNNVANTPASVMGQIFDEIEAYAIRSGIKVTVFMALIIKESPNNPKTQVFNNGIKLIANAVNSDHIKVIVVDMENGAGINYATEMVDQWHPNNIGYEKMAQLWFEKLSDNMAILGNDEDLAYANEVKVFPNPTESDFTIVIDNSNWRKFEVSISDISGKVFKPIALVHNRNNKINVSLQGFPSGQYFIRLVSDKDSIVKKIFKN